MLFFALLVQARGETHGCIGCESACFSDCSDKYKTEIIDQDVLPGGGGFAGSLAQTGSGKLDSNQAKVALEMSYLDCMEMSGQCSKWTQDEDAFHAAPAKFQQRIIQMKADDVPWAQVGKQMLMNRKCVHEVGARVQAAHAEKKLKHAKTFLRHTTQLKKEMSLSLEQEHQPYFFDGGVFEKGLLKLSECMDICITGFCACPGPDGNYMSRYPADVSDAAAEDAGAPTSDQADDVQEVVQEIQEAVNAPAPAPAPATGGDDDDDAASNGPCEELFPGYGMCQGNGAGCWAAGGNPADAMCDP